MDLLSSAAILGGGNTQSVPGKLAIKVVRGARAAQIPSPPSCLSYGLVQYPRRDISGIVPCTMYHRRCRGREGEGVQPWDRPQELHGEGGGVGLQPWDCPQAPQERAEGGAQPWDHPQVLPEEGRG